MDKVRVGIVFGGKSAEHAVSLMSVASVLKAIDPKKYETTLFYITRAGIWHVVSSLEMLDHVVNRTTRPIDQDVLDQLYRQEIILPVIHGPHGEDGSLQGLFESLELPYVGSKVLGSAVSMDKIISKKILSQAGLSAVKYFELYEALTETKYCALQAWIEMVGYPVFVKPSNMGSSVGITKVSCETQLKPAILEALKYDQRILIEEGIDAREIECAVLEYEGLQVSGVGEVIAAGDFYDYNAKYTDDGQEKMMVPAQNLSDETIQAIRGYAEAAFLAHGCKGLARIDFFLEKDTNRIILNEINTLPGMTVFSMYPSLFEAQGIDYRTLIDYMIRNELTR